MHAHREHVLGPATQQLADGELGRQPAPARRPDVVAVDPHAHAGVDALEAQHAPSRGKSSGTTNRSR